MCDKGTHFSIVFFCINIESCINQMNQSINGRSWNNDSFIVWKSLINLFSQLIITIIVIKYTLNVICHVTFKQTFETCFMQFIWSTYVKWSKREGHFYVIFALELQITYCVYSCRFDGNWKKKLQNVMKEIFSFSINPSSWKE